MRISFLRFLAAATLCAASIAHSQVLFSDNFDGSPYSDDATLVLGPNNLAHGVWNNFNNAGDGTVITSTDAYVSPNRALALIVPNEEGAQRAQVIGKFSEDGSTVQTITDGLKLRFDFMMADAAFTTQIYIWGTGGYAGWLVLNSNATAYHSGGNDLFYSGLTADTWYTVEFDMPKIVSASDVYTVNLYDSGNTLLGSSTGLFNTTGVTDYQFFTFYNDIKGRTSYIDNVSVIPEAGTTALLFLGLGLGLARRGVRR